MEHDGVVYHVQTEDKGLETPLILSLVYSGGAILASKRSRYEDLIASGFTDEVLSERLKRQHMLICAAIHAGRVGDLKRMAGAEPEMAVVGTPVDSEALAPALVEEKPDAPEAAAQQDAGASAPPTEAVSPTDPHTVHDPRRQSPLGELGREAEGLRISLLDEGEFRSGDTPTLRIMVSQLSGTTEKPMNGAVVSVKVLGTAFRPLIYSLKTRHDGVAIVLAQIPSFTSGRAAILIRALAGDSETELRRVIHAD
ncbi:MAG: hypothetical protein ACR2IB_02160 [Pyrinomonadaceae bacterium]